MKWNELRRIAIKHGFVFHRELKGHDIYMNPKTGVKIMLERHQSQEVRAGLMHKLKKEIGF
ncbi:type II toxin-antitoxin system HicA family toxin [uncultured Prevotella sp.]|jgi:predicted RNA binding protein YcfA (HicA-like mRNA interferase family)|uniref:type II toxin-antitoxin system HicA family toxin n=1 Tax=uncultured Prevotella sp. TaxID=159272 RepID=UPI0034449270